MAQSFPYFTSSSTPPPSSRIPSTSQIQQQSISGSSKRDSTLPSSVSNQNVNVNRQSSLHQQLFAQQQQQQHGGILDRPLNRSKGSEVSSGAWAFLFGEIVSYSQSRVDSVTDLEKRLSSLGYEAGSRILSLLLLRNTQASGTKEPKREHRLIPALQFVHTQVYKYIFGKPADGLERSVEGEDEYMLTLNQPPLTQHISIPKDMSQLSVEAYTAGLVEGVMDGLGLPARVTAHTVGTDQFPQRTVILIKLDQKVMDREAVLGK